MVRWGVVQEYGSVRVSKCPTGKCRRRRGVEVDRWRVDSELVRTRREAEEERMEGKGRGKKEEQEGGASCI